MKENKKWDAFSFIYFLIQILYLFLALIISFSSYKPATTEENDEAKEFEPKENDGASEEKTEDGKEPEEKPEEDKKDESSEDENKNESEDDEEQRAKKLFGLK